VGVIYHASVEFKGSNASNAKYGNGIRKVAVIAAIILFPSLKFDQDDQIRLA
jgi:hypothetical protein